MPETKAVDDLDIVLKYGGGINSSASEEEISERESASGGQNVELELDNHELKPRKPFDLLDTTPDGS